jgi:hypothetical protein
MESNRLSLKSATKGKAERRHTHVEARAGYTHVRKSMIDLSLQRQKSRRCKGCHRQTDVAERNVSAPVGINTRPDHDSLHRATLPDNIRVLIGMREELACDVS